MLRFVRHHGQAFETAANQAAAMTDGGRLSKVRDVGVLDGCFDVDLLNETSQAGPENDPCPWRLIPLRANGGDSFLYLVVELEHADLSARRIGIR